MIRLRVIRPGPFRSEHFASEARRAAQKHIARVKRDFYKTTAGWDHEVVFRQQSRFSQKEVRWEVYTTDQIYTWVNDGTATWRGKAKYPIAPVRAKSLHYLENYDPSTTPGSLESKRPREYGKDIFRQLVFHPGIEPRRFDQTIFNERIPEYLDDLDKAWERAVVLSNHDMGSDSRPLPRSSFSEVISSASQIASLPIELFRSAYFRVNRIVQGAKTFTFRSRR